MMWLALGLLILCMSVTANAQTSRPQKVDDLVQLLRDPEVRSWLEKQAPSTAPSPDVGSKDYLSAWEAAMRSRVDDILGAFPRIPGQLAEAFSRAHQDAISHGFAPVLIILVGLIAIGAGAERLFARQWPTNRPDLAAARLLPLAVFATVMAIVFFAVEWPPLVRMILLVSLLALVAYRIFSALIDMAGLQPSILRRVRLFVAVLILACAAASLGTPLSVDPAATSAISWCFSIALLLLALEAAWATGARPMRTKVALTVFPLAIWLLWCLGLKGLFWLGVYALALPAAVRAVGHAAEILFPSKPDSTRHVLVARGSRSLVILLAVGWLSLVWRLDPNSLTRIDPAIGAIAHGLLKSVIILLGADITWHLARSWIDRTLATPGDTLLPSDETARRARLHTLLPIFRNVLAVMVIVMAALIILAELGVKIGPLLAGAGIFGVALGFGSQTLVKDVISGVFYMLDDAFRVGEYIQAKSYKGTVEGFSLRSVRLRHHRGPVFTVPFGELGAVENLSRDWAIDKFKISVGYNTDIDKARKILKDIGATLLADPELGPLFIQPLKMKGVEEFGDYGMVLSFAMTTVPGQQTFIRRKAYAMIRDAFQKNGIDFAQPSVQVGGDEKAAAAAATAIKVSAAAKMPTAEG